MAVLKEKIGQVVESPLRVVSKKPSLSLIKKAIEDKQFDTSFDGLKVYREGCYSNDEFQVNVENLVFEFSVTIDLEQIEIEFIKAFNEDCKDIIYSAKDQYIMETYLEELLINEIS